MSKNNALQKLLSATTSPWFNYIFIGLTLVIVVFAHEIFGVPVSQDEKPSVLQFILTFVFAGAALSAEFFRKTLDFQLNSRICIALPVMMNKDLVTKNYLSMVLFSHDELDESNLDNFIEDGSQLNEIASDIFDLYNSDATYENTELNEFVKHLKDDTYRESSRLAVPSCVSRGYNLSVADIIIRQNLLHPDERFSQLVAVSVTGKLKGLIAQIDWHDHPHAEGLFLA